MSAVSVVAVGIKDNKITKMPVVLPLTSKPSTPNRKMPVSSALRTVRPMILKSLTSSAGQVGPSSNSVFVPTVMPYLLPVASMIAALLPVIVRSLVLTLTVGPVYVPGATLIVSPGEAALTASWIASVLPVADTLIVLACAAASSMQHAPARTVASAAVSLIVGRALLFSAISSSSLW